MKAKRKRELEGLTAEKMSMWPNCAVPDCEYKCCLALDSPYCWKHTKNKKALRRRDAPGIIGPQIEPPREKRK